MIIAQLTDLHVRANGHPAFARSDTLGALDKAVDHLNEIVPGIDAIILSGDLADKAQPEDYATLRPLLDRLAAPWFAVPGNHDGRDAMRDSLTDFDWMPKEGFIQFCIEQFPVRIIGLDTVVEGRPHGALCAQRVAWLDDCLSAAPDRPTLIFLHHPPFETGIRHMDVMRLLDAEGFAEVVQRHAQIEHIACGHVHRAIQSTFAGVAATVGPSPAHAVCLDLEPDAEAQFCFEPPAIRLFRWDETGQTLATHLSYIGTFDGPYPFFDKAGCPVES